MTLSFCTAGVRVDLVGLDGEVRELVRQVAANLIVDPADLLADTCADSPFVRVTPREVDVPDGCDTGQAAARWLHALHVAALAHTPTLPVHAAAVAGPSGCVVLPGPSGAGKSTLTAAAMQSGLLLVSDETACFTSPVGDVLPHPRFLKLSRSSRRLLGVSGPADPDLEIALPPSTFGEAAAPTASFPCRFVVLPTREPGRRAALEPLSRSGALTALSRCRLAADARLWPTERVWTYLCDLVRQVQVAELRFDDPREAADLLARLTDVPSPRVS